MICDCCKRDVDRIRGSGWHGDDRICTECFIEWYDGDDPTITAENVASKERIGNFIRAKHGLPALSAVRRMEDPIYDKAVMVVKASNPPSVAKLQRTLLIGYNRAQRLMDAIAEAGIVERVVYENGLGYRLVPNARNEGPPLAAVPLG